MTRIFSSHWKDYELIDAGNSKKLERWGDFITIRPERNAYFIPGLNFSKWKEMAHFEFQESSSTSGEWIHLKENLPKEWKIKFDTIQFQLKLTQFKHVGIFPEQMLNWDFIKKNTKKNDKFLNLFAYTGGASLIAKSNDATVFHCDSVKQVISWAKENMEISNLSDIYWVLDDAMKFAEREVKRANKYDGIIMDPPAFGLGVKKERWKIENKFPELVKIAKELLNEKGFLIINTYSPRLNEEKIMEICQSYFPVSAIQVNKLCIKSKTGKILEYGERTLIQK